MPLLRGKHVPRGLRLPGTAIPKLILAGTYVSRGERSFYAVRDRRECLVIELDGQRYARFVVQTQDAQAVAAQIQNVRRRADIQLDAVADDPS